MEQNISPALAISQRHTQAVLLDVRSSAANKEDAEDVLLEVFLHTVKKQVPHALLEGEQRAWLLHVTQQTLVDNS